MASQAAPGRAGGAGIRPRGSFLDRERTVAPPGYSRWLIPPAALAVHLSIGQVYAFSVFKTPLQEHFGTEGTPIAVIFSIAIVGDHLTLKSPGMGESLDADLGGPFVVNAGDPGKTMTRAERVSPTVIRLTDMQLGKVTQIATYTVAADGATITGEWVDPRDGSKGTFVARKQ